MINDAHNQPDGAIRLRIVGPHVPGQDRVPRYNRLAHRGARRRGGNNFGPPRNAPPHAAHIGQALGAGGGAQVNPPYIPRAALQPLIHGNAQAPPHGNDNQADPGAAGQPRPVVGRGNAPHIRAPLDIHGYVQRLNNLRLDDYRAQGVGDMGIDLRQVGLEQLDGDREFRARRDRIPWIHHVIREVDVNVNESHQYGWAQFGIRTGSGLFYDEAEVVELLAYNTADMVEYQEEHGVSWRILDITSNHVVHDLHGANENDGVALHHRLGNAPFYTFRELMPSVEYIYARTETPVRSFRGYELSRTFAMFIAAMVIAVVYVFINHMCYGYIRPTVDVCSEVYFYYVFLHSCYVGFRGLSVQLARDRFVAILSSEMGLITFPFLLCMVQLALSSYFMVFTRDKYLILWTVIYYPRYYLASVVHYILVAILGSMYAFNHWGAEQVLRRYFSYAQYLWTEARSNCNPRNWIRVQTANYANVVLEPDLWTAFDPDDMLDNVVDPGVRTVLRVVPHCYNAYRRVCISNHVLNVLRTKHALNRGHDFNAPRWMSTLLETYRREVYIHYYDIFLNTVLFYLNEMKYSQGLVKAVVGGKSSMPET